ncbi:MAG TPA: hypothetical protein VG900_00170 [Hyphomicrobiaceae bacterium]|jgi:hypothetical protein|nr:hypothetical protein [Hyphomicrobiaceae bacterium]
MKYLLSGAAGALALGFMAMSAQAAPLGGVAADLKAAAGPTSSAQDVHWRRRCWRNRWGHLHCRRVWVEPYYGYYDTYPYYYGPGIGLYFGGRGRHHHHRHH